MANATVPYVGPDGRLWIDITATKTLLATEFGWVQNILTDGLTLTMPASATVLAGATIILRNGGVPVTSGPVGSGSNGQIGFILTPASGDGITGNGFTAATDKGITYVKASGNVGDEVELSCGGANTAKAWNVARIKGKLAAWTRTA